jgi:hypothetical protein
MLLRVPLVEFSVWFLWVWFFKLLVGNVVNILVTYHPDMYCSCISDDIFNVADTVTGSQLWSHVGEIPWHDMCKASTNLACWWWMSSSVTRGMVKLLTATPLRCWWLGWSQSHINVFYTKAFLPISWHDKSLCIIRSLPVFMGNILECFIMT